MYPAIAIADEVRTMNPEAAIMFAGTRERMEWGAVPMAGYEIAPIAAAGFQRALSVRNLIMPFKMVRGLAQSVSLIRAFDPDVAVGTGGYVTGPVLMAAVLGGRPTLVQEQNAYPGVTNRILARFASEIHVAFPEATEFFPRDRCVVTGNPTRSELEHADRGEARRFFDLPEDSRVLLVFGGSLGSQALNEVLLQHWSRIASEGVYVIWQTGSRYYERVRDTLGEAPWIRLREYIDRMELAYAAADLALCRAGAITCSELQVSGTPAVLVPSPNVAEDHQTKNARSLEGAGAAVVIHESELESGLVARLHDILFDQERLDRMARSARASAHPEAATAIAESVLRLASGGTHSEAGRR